MAPIPKGGTVAVTGASGFIGGWCVKLLLDKGYRVRACVRNAGDESKCGFLRQLPGHASGRLTLHSANIDDDGCLDEVFKGCHGVAHIAHISSYDDEAYVRRVCGHIIASIDRSGSVCRIVVTSSIAAMMYEMDSQELVRRPVLFEDRYPDDTNPKRTFEFQGYSMGKVYAQLAFSEAAEKSGGRWDAITCCPADNVGPILSAHHKNLGPWQHVVELMLKGNTIKDYPGMVSFRPWMIVDVRDDAEAHIRLLESVHCKNGERFIAWSTERRDPAEVVKDIGRVLPELGHKPALVPLEYSQRSLQDEEKYRRIWGGVDLRNDRIRAVTGMSFRPWDESLRDCAESLLALGKVQPSSNLQSKL